MKKLIIAATVLVGIALGVGTASAATAITSGAGNKVSQPPPGGTSGDIVVAWNQQLLQIVLTPGAQPATVHATRSFAILHAAIYDSVVSITKDAPPYLFPRHAGSALPEPQLQTASRPGPAACG